MIKKIILFIVVFSIVMLIISYFINLKKIDDNKYIANNFDTETDSIKLENMGNGYTQDKRYVYENNKIIVDKSINNPFALAATDLEKLSPQDDSAIEVIIASYYDLVLHYGNNSKYSVFNKLKFMDPLDFFIPYLNELNSNNFNSYDQKITTFPILKLAFFIKDSPGFSKDIPYSGGAGMGGEVLGKKLDDPSTLFVYTKFETQDYLGASAHECKQNGITIEKFIFKKINNHWKIFDFESDIDFWITTSGGDGAENCKEINQDKLEKYKIFNTLHENN